MLPIVTIEIELNQFNGDCGACKRREENRRVCNKRAKVRERERETWRGVVGVGKFQSGVELAETGKKRLCLFTGNNVVLFDNVRVQILFFQFNTKYINSY